MFKVRRGDAPATIPPVQVPANLRQSRKPATPMNNKGPGPNDGNESKPRTETPLNIREHDDQGEGSFPVLERG